MGKLIPDQRFRVLPRGRANEGRRTVAPNCTKGRASAGCADADSEAPGSPYPECAAAGCEAAACAAAGCEAAACAAAGCAAAGCADADNARKLRVARRDPGPPAAAPSL